MTKSHICLLLVAVLALCLLGQAVKAEEEATAIDSDANLNVLQIVAKRGYAIETHNVTTADRYVLTMFRLPKSYTETQSGATAATNKPAVLLQHGLLDSSYTWVLNYRTQSLAFLLADAGYDVWLGNNRGTTWSRTHLDYTTDQEAFWDFTWDDMGNYDMPAMITYILSTTGRPTISYIGHSEGTTQAFVGFSNNSAIAKKVSFFGALAPVGWTGNSISPVFSLLAKTYIDNAFKALGIYEFLTDLGIITSVIGKYACAFGDIACSNFLNVLTGPSVNINASRVHVYITQYPSGTSVKNMGHYAQGIRDGYFRRYDYGCSCSTLLPISLCLSSICGNKAAYGSFTPPNYDLSAMKYPRTAFLTGKDDWLAQPADINKLRNGLPSGVVVSDVEYDVNHLDFTWSYNITDLIYKPLMTLMAKYEGKGY